MFMKTTLSTTRLAFFFIDEGVFRGLTLRLLLFLIYNNQLYYGFSSKPRLFVDGPLLFLVKILKYLIKISLQNLNLD